MCLEVFPPLLRVLCEGVNLEEGRERERKEREGSGGREGWREEMAGLDMCSASCVRQVIIFCSRES